MTDSAAGGTSLASTAETESETVMPKTNPPATRADVWSAAGAVILLLVGAFYWTNDRIDSLDDEVDAIARSLARIEGHLGIGFPPKESEPTE